MKIKVGMHYKSEDWGDIIEIVDIKDYMVFFNIVYDPKNYYAVIDNSWSIGVIEINYRILPYCNTPLWDALRG